jgi:hypothetical protein
LKRCEATCTYKDRARTGKPKVSDKRDDRLLVRASLQNRKATVNELRRDWKTSNVFASATTGRRRLHEAGLYGHLAVKKLLFSPRHRQLRLNFAREHADYGQL